MTIPKAGRRQRLSLPDSLREEQEGGRALGLGKWRIWELETPGLLFLAAGRRLSVKVCP